MIENGVATFDAKELTTRTINLELRRLLYEEGVPEVVVQNPQARHSLGVGILTRCKITFEGSLGYFGCGIIDGPEIHIKGRVGWSACENMMSGVVVVDSNAGSLTGAAIRGGDLVIKGRVGARTGIDQKGGTIIVCGDAGSMNGFMMQRGHQIILGNVGPGLGDSMYDGTIYVGGTVKSLGIDCVPGEWTDADTEFIERKFSDLRARLSARAAEVRLREGALQLRLARARRAEARDLRAPMADAPGREGRPRAEPHLHARGDQRHPHQVGARPLPHARLLDLQADAALGRARLPPRHADALRDRGLPREVRDEDGARRPLREEADRARHPDLHHGHVASARSALEAKMALAKGASMAGTATCSGEGGMIPPERDYSTKWYYQCIQSRYGFNPHHLMLADAVEFFIGQGCKVGLGGHLMGQKVTEQVAEMRSLPAGIDQRSPARHPDWLGPDDLSLKVQEIREATDYQIPIQLKLGASRVYDDVRMAAKCGPDIIYLDGAEGGTGAGPHIATEETGIPLMAAIPEARRALEDVGLSDEIDLVVAGGIRNGADVAKCIALGAKAVAIGHSALMALNCNKEIPGVTDYEGTVGVPAGQCYHCHTGRCPVGITTQDPELRKRLVVEDAAVRVYNFLTTLTMELQMLARACGKTNVHSLEPEDLAALTVEASAMAKVPLAGTTYTVGVTEHEILAEVKRLLAKKAEDDLEANQTASVSRLRAVEP